MLIKNKLFIMSLFFILSANASTVVDEEEKQISTGVIITAINSNDVRAVYNFGGYEIKDSPIYKGQAAYINLPMIHPYHPCGSTFFQYFPLIAIDKSKTNFFNIQMAVAPDFEVDANEQKQSFRPHHFVHSMGNENTNNSINFKIYHGGGIIEGQFNDTYSSHDNVASPNCSHLPPYVFTGETESILIKYTLNNCNFWTILMNNGEVFENKVLYFGEEKSIDQFNFTTIIELLKREVTSNGSEEFHTSLIEAFNLKI